MCAVLQVQDYVLWCSQLIGAMAAEESISDVATADLQLAQHQQLWAEMEARQETYQQALDIGEGLQTQDRSNRKEVRRTDFQLVDMVPPVWCQSCKSICLSFFQVLEKLDALQAERGKLEDQWKKKQRWLETVHLEQIFYRDVNNMDKTSSSQEVLLLLCLFSTRKSDSVFAVSETCVFTDPFTEQHSGQHSRRDRGFNQTPRSF